MNRDQGLPFAGLEAGGMVSERMDEYIVPPELGDQAGLLGAIALAKQSTLRTDL